MPRKRKTEKRKSESHPDAYSFRCKNCGHLETSENAGESHIPHACSVCGHGVKFHERTGLKQLEPDNWEKLWEMTEKQLDKLGLTKDEVEEHEGDENSPANVALQGRDIQVQAQESTGVKDKG